MALSPDEAKWVEGVSQQTGIDPRVLIAWAASEGHPGDQAFNYLNIQVQTAQSVGVKPAGTLAADTAAFGSVQDGITASVREIRNLGLTREAGKTPAATISDIAASPWASSHYGGPGGPNLQRVFAGMFGGQAGLSSSYMGPGKAPEVAATAGTGSAADWTSGGTSLVTKPVQAIKDAISFPEKVFAFLTSWRFAELLGGVLLILLGFYLIGRQFGVTPGLKVEAAEPLVVGNPIAKAQRSRASSRSVADAEGQGQLAAERHYARRAARESRTAELRRAEPSAQDRSQPGDFFEATEAA